ncbi:hypothetical protein [Paenibacillus glycanilyticus]|uniref:Uncharacterized protein n=1 Tax=Paenibacillus glycanilyticus TaxID=126569 RepID=A0ABQ6NV94_9BACL|nr:hypothetical protein [Paenibacillus glycanilyticus]GMK47894.1 hypothetical protein PghCCS26_50240 [Paenibacillus glycanilyticus]
MRLQFIVFIAFSISLILWLEWPKLKKWGVKEKAVFFSLLAVICIFMFVDVPDTPGTPTLDEFLFKPLKRFVQP